MSKLAMPEPVAQVVSDFQIFWSGTGPIAPLVERNGVKVGSLLITTDQAEAYKDACVREALEEAVKILQDKAEKHGELAETEHNYDERTILQSDAWKFRVCANEIRALIK